MINYLINLINVQQMKIQQFFPAFIIFIITGLVISFLISCAGGGRKK